MTYELPDEPYLGTHEDINGCQVDIYGYTADQMQAAYQAGEATAREDLTIAYMSGYHKGREAMKAECVKAVDEQDDLTPLDWMLLRTGSRSLK